MMIQGQRGNEVQRRFIRLDEIEQKTTMTKGDVFAAVEEKRLSLCAYVDLNELGSLVMRDKKMVIRSVFDYQGLTRLTPDLSHQFAVLMQPQQVKLLHILEPQNITAWRSISEVYHNIKQCDYTYSEKAPNQPDVAFWVFAAIRVKPTAAKSLSPLLSVLENACGKALNKETIGFDVGPEMRQAQRLSVEHVTVLPEQLRVDLKEIIDVFGEAKIRRTLPEAEVSDSVSVDILLSHPIEKVVCRILQVYGTELKAPNVWDVMREDARNELSRQFDIDGYIEEINNERLIWMDDSGRESQVTYASFRQKYLVKVKKHLKERVVTG
ncbi:hypothetical protein AB0243_004282 [Vibrio vulnificus]